MSYELQEIYERAETAETALADALEYIHVMLPGAFKRDPKLQAAVARLQRCKLKSLQATIELFKEP